MERPTDGQPTSGQGIFGMGGRVRVGIAVLAVTALGAVLFLLLNQRDADVGVTPSAVGPTPLLPLINGSTTVLPVLAPDGSALRYGQTGSSSCINPATKQEWRVRWKVGASAGATDAVSRATMLVTGLDVRIANGDWLDQASQTWAMRWTPTLREVLTVTGGETFDRRGTLTVLNQTAIRVDQSPRFVTPDGACTVYLIPFGSGPIRVGDAAPAKSVAILGDSLLAQLSAPDGDTLTGTGSLFARLPNVRLGVDAQAGRLWTQTPDQYPPLDVANGFMLDEIRGTADADVRVIALGANDAGWVTRAPAGQEETRAAWMLLHLAPIIDELDAADHCTVLLTIGDRDTRYLDSPEPEYRGIATRLNDYLRQRVKDSTSGNLRLSDWAKISASHHVSDPEPWFGPDTLHLNTPGRKAYADQIAAATTMC